MLHCLEASERFGIGRHGIGRYFCMQPLNRRIGPGLDLLAKDVQ
jgi:hypothetical protein